VVGEADAVTIGAGAAVVCAGIRPRGVLQRNEMGRAAALLQECHRTDGVSKLGVLQVIHACDFAAPAVVNIFPVHGNYFTGLIVVFPPLFAKDCPNLVPVCV